MRFFLLAAVAATCACSTASQAGNVPEYTYQVVHAYPHDPRRLHRGPVLPRRVPLREHRPERTSRPSARSSWKPARCCRSATCPAAYFGEGIVNWKDRLLELTWKAHRGFIYDLASFAPRSEFHYPGEGWGLTQDGKRIIMSDGTPQLRFWDPETLNEIGRITVTAQGQPVADLNELEWVKGEIYANIWQTDRIARIDPTTGHVVGWIDCTGLLPDSERIPNTPTFSTASPTTPPTTASSSPASAGPSSSKSAWCRSPRNEGRAYATLVSRRYSASDSAGSSTHSV